MIKRNMMLLSCAFVLALAFTAVNAEAQRVQFRSNGGRYSRSFHSGWHRYWGGPSIGFYYAPAPVYMVDGYGDPSYYTGTSFWYSNPSFGLSVNVGGGGHGHRGHRHDRR